MRKQSGITLIALVITIIVLLILAGISISMAIGQNGIVSQANNAVVANKKAQAREEVALAWSGALTRYWSDWADGTRTRTMKNYLAGTGIEFINGGTKPNDGATVKYSSEGVDYIYEISGDGNVSLLGDSASTTKNAASAALTPRDYYGKTVNYSANGLTDWKIFYSNGSNFFIIASDFIPVDKIPNETGIAKTGTYQAVFSNVPATYDTENRQDKLFMVEGFNFNPEYVNSKCISKLLNTGIWSGFVDSTYATYAVGGPSIPMWIESWNDYYPDDLLEYWPTAYSPSSAIHGHAVCTYDSEYLDARIDGSVMRAKEGYHNTLYYSHTAGYSGCWAYWMTSPAFHAQNRIMHIYCEGHVGNDTNTGLGNGIRPVIALKSNVELLDGTDGYDFNLSIR